MSYLITGIYDTSVYLLDTTDKKMTQVCNVQSILSPLGQPVNTQFLEIGDALTVYQNYLYMSPYSSNRLYETATYLNSNPNCSWVISNYPYIRPFGPSEKNFYYVVGVKILEYSYTHRTQDIIARIKYIAPEVTGIINNFYSKIGKYVLQEALARCLSDPDSIIAIVECPHNRYSSNSEKLFEVLNIKITIINLENIETQYINPGGQIEFVLLWVNNSHNILYTTLEKQQIENPSISSTVSLKNMKMSVAPYMSPFQSAQDMIKSLPINSWDKIRKEFYIYNEPEKTTKLLKALIEQEGEIVEVAVKSKLTRVFDRKLEDEALYMFAVQDNPNFLKLYGAFWDKFEGQHRYNIVMELASENLETRIRRWEEDGFPSHDRQEEAYHALVQLIKAMSVLNSKNISHRDIKPQNILIDKNGNYKIVDFDISRAITRNLDGETLMDLKFERSAISEYFSPEMSDYYKGKFCAEILFNKSDVYSLGMTILRMVTNKDFYYWNNNYSQLQSHVHGIIDEAVTKSELNTLLKLMMTVDPISRPKFRVLEKQLSVSYDSVTPFYS